MSKKQKKAGPHDPKGLHYVFDFGTHRYKSMQWVIDNHPDYVQYCIKNLYGFRLNKEAQTALDQVVKKVT